MVEPNPDVDTYVEQAPENRREGLRLLRDLCREHLPGFTETFRYRMPGYVRADETEGEIGFAAQKHYLSFYVTRTDVMDAHRDRLTGLDLGKGAIRYRRTDQIDVDVVRSILRMTAATRGPIC
jgi:uncharacterized protein YdhG (YjbR/CyaY superfamily)